MYLVTLDRGSLARLRMIPLRIVRMRLQRASETDASWLQESLDLGSAPLGARVELTEDGCLEARWA
jgi:poly-gamma-glutamate synthesis protein (capsule biosynthesis protein)